MSPSLWVSMDERCGMGVVMHGEKKQVWEERMEERDQEREKTSDVMVGKGHQRRGH